MNNNCARTLIPLTLTGRHLSILEVFHRHQRRALKVETVAALGTIARRESVGALLDDLAGYGLIYLPHGRNSGYALTDVGRLLLSELLKEEVQIVRAETRPKDVT